MSSDLPNETIKPAYPLGDSNADVPSKTDKKDTPTQPVPKDEPKKVVAPQPPDGD